MLMYVRKANYKVFESATFGARFTLFTSFSSSENLLIKLFSAFPNDGTIKGLKNVLTGVFGALAVLILKT